MGKIEEEDETYEDEGKEDWEEKNVWLIEICPSKDYINTSIFLFTEFLMFMNLENGKMDISW